jgi:zinc protease
MSSPSAAPPAIRPAVLDNGLTVLVREVRTAPLASVWCWYRVGSKDEGAGLTGASHFVEHMNFKGSTNIPRDQVKGLVEKFGGTWNGYTWLDQTTYFETASRDALDRMLFIEAERMANCLYEPEDCEAERTVIISELMGGENDPDQLLEIELTATALKAHPYRHPTIGWLSDLQAMRRDDLYVHYRRYYGPNNAALVVVGDVDADDVFRRAERHFGTIQSVVDPPRPRTVEPPPLGERRVLLEREGTTAYLKLAWHAPAVDDPDFLPMLVLDAILTGAKGVNVWASFRTPPPQRRSRLYRALVDTGRASMVGGSLIPTQHPFLYTISITVTDGVTIADVEREALEAIDRLRADGITAEELERARRQLAARFVFENDSVTNIAHQIGFFQTVSTLDAHLTMPGRLAGVTKEQVEAAARARLAPGRRTVGWFKPAPGDGAAAGARP